MLLLLLGPALFLPGCLSHLACSDYYARLTHSKSAYGANLQPTQATGLGKPARAVPGE